MKKLMLISFALTLVMSLLALAQEATKPGEMKQETPKAEKASPKAVSLSGKVSADGTTFVDKDNKSWTVTNPEALRSEEHTSELQSLAYLVCRLLLEKKKKVSIH